jgi:MFS superfamily sulfate permease-like transporter
MLGRLADSGTCVDVGRHPEAGPSPGLLIFQPRGILLFADANRIRNRLPELVKPTGKPLQAVLINLEASPEIDVTSLEIVDQLRSELEESDVALHFARVSDEAQDLFRRRLFRERLGQDHVFRGVDVAANAFLNRSVTAAPQVPLEPTRA